MDVATIYSLYVCGIIGFFIYFLVLFITKQFFNNEIRPSSDVDDANDERRTRITDVTTDRSSEGVTSLMVNSDDTVFGVPSRERVQEERLEAEKRRCKENANDQHTIADDDETEDGGKESDHEEEEYKVFQAYVNESNLNEYTDEFGVLPGLMKYISENIQTWKTRTLKIAIIGNSGTGKSSFINAIRGLKPEDKGAAPVGVIETTMEKQEYVLPSNENISLWDLPGVGTRSFKKTDYLNACNLKEFDAFMILSASRFSENDVWLANEILKLGSYIFFLRTQIDTDLTNEINDHPSTYNEACCLQKMKMDIVRNLKKWKYPQKRSGIYLVSSRESFKFDFPKLLLKLNRLLSKKGFYLRRVLKNHLKTISDKKIELKKRHFVLQKISLMFFGIGFGLLKFCTRQMQENCKIAFSLDDNTIESISDEIGMSVNYLKTKELYYFVYLEERLEQFDHSALTFTGEEGFDEKSMRFVRALFLPSYDIFVKRLNFACHVMAMDEARLIDLRLNHLEEQLRPF